MLLDTGVDIRTAIAERLRFDEAIMAIVGDNVYRQVAPQKAPRPMLIWELTSHEFTERMTASGEFDPSDVSVTCIADDTDVVDRLSAAVKTCLTSWAGQLADAEVRKAFLLREYDGFIDPEDASDNGLYTITIESRIWYRSTYYGAAT